MLRRYIKGMHERILGYYNKHPINYLYSEYLEYVTCHTCRSPNTILQKDSRIFFLQCEACGSRCSVASIKHGYFKHSYSLFIYVYICIYVCIYICLFMTGFKLSRANEQPSEQKPHNYFTLLFPFMRLINKIDIYINITLCVFCELFLEVVITSSHMFASQHNFETK